MLIDGAVAFPLLSILRSTAFHFVISYTVLIKTLRLSPLAGVSGVDGVWSLHVVMRQAGTYSMLLATALSFMSVLLHNLRL